ncbi:Hypothetical protein EIN_206880, partial [Entamoeba invadens IP1]
RVLWSKM